MLFKDQILATNTVDFGWSLYCALYLNTLCAVEAAEDLLGNESTAHPSLAPTHLRSEMDTFGSSCVSSGPRLTSPRWYVLPAFLLGRRPATIRAIHEVDVLTETRENNTNNLPDTPKAGSGGEEQRIYLFSRRSESNPSCHL